MNYNLETTYSYGSIKDVSLPNFVMMWGIPGSGKSSYAENIFGDSYTIVSSDILREELFGDINDMDHNGEVFEAMKKRTINTLQKGKNVVYDATNIVYKRRVALLTELKKIKCNKIIHCMIVPFSICLSRNSNRERTVPYMSLYKMRCQTSIPYFYEGWDMIHLHITPITQNHIALYPKDVGYMHRSYNQVNANHTYTLGQHCEFVGDYVKKAINKKEQTQSPYPHKNSIIEAAYMHDIGKAHTQTFKTGDPNAHYYGHEFCGAYESLFYERNQDNTDLLSDILYRAILIQWHMVPYHWEAKDCTNPEKVITKYKNIWGHELFQNIMMIHEADKTCH